MYLSELSCPILYSNNESRHRISYKIACVLSEDSDQPAQSRRLIRVFAVRLKMLVSLATHCVPCKDSDQTLRMRRLI